jgi:hypothetical protein
LDGADVDASLELVGGEAVSEKMWRDLLLDSGADAGLTDRSFRPLPAWMCRSFRAPST